MTKNDKDDAVLEALFSSARRAETPDERFLARLMDDADAAAEQNVRTLANTPVITPAHTPWWLRWLPASGLTAAALAGVWIGVAVPESDLAAEYFFAFDGIESDAPGLSSGFGIGAILETDG